MIIAIDGPVAAGKTTTAKYLAHKLGFNILDTGAMYRAVGIGAHTAGLDPNKDDLTDYVESHPVSFDNGHVFIDGQDVTDAIRTPLSDKLVTPTCEQPSVRRVLTELQREIAATGN